LSETPNLAEARESDRFKQFLDHMLFAVVAAELGTAETITYANLGLERQIGKPAADILGQTWSILSGAVDCPGG
jgi:PAS domain-containing protein